MWLHTGYFPTAVDVLYFFTPGAPPGTLPSSLSRFGHFHRVQRVLQLFGGKHLSLERDLPDGLSGLEAFFGNIGCVIIANQRGQ